MATKRKARNSERGAVRPTETKTSSSSRGLVLRVIQKDQNCLWLADFVQQLGEKFFGVERYEELSTQQRAGWIRFNNAMARISRKVVQGEADFLSLLRFLERISSEEGDVELAEIEAEVEALATEATSREADSSSKALLDEVIDERRDKRKQEMRDWESRRMVQLAWDFIVLGATVCCLVLAVLIILGVVGDEARMIGGTAVTGGIAVIGLLQVIIWGKWNPPPPGQFR